MSIHGSYVRKRLRIVVFVLCGLLLAVGLALVGLYSAFRHVPAAYRRALAADPVEQEKASNEAVRKATALVSQTEKEGKWHTRFTAEQINGWLAVDMKKNHPDLLPPELSEPRVAISPQQMTLFCRVERGNVSGILSLCVDVYLAEPDLVALRLRRARAGALPLPLGEVLERITQEARRRQLRLTWKQTEGDPVALLRLSLEGGKENRTMQIEAIELREGEVVLSGTTK